MTPETVTMATRANIAWGDAREHLGRVRERADADPTERNHTAEAEAMAVARRAWKEWQAALVAADFGAMPPAEKALDDG
jgi:hypothetical protein